MILTDTMIKITTATLVAVLVCGSLYYKGRSDGKDIEIAKYEQAKQEWQAKVSDLQSQLDKNTQNTTQQYITKVVQGKDVIKYVNTQPEIVVKYVPSACTVPKGFVALHNKAVEGASLEAIQDVPLNAAEVSETSLADVAKTVTVNYYQYNQLRNQVIALQTIIKDYQQKQQELGIEK